MTNFDPNNQRDIAGFVSRCIARHNLIALATTNQDGTPWVVCVNLTMDNNLNFIWRSDKNAEHSQNIAKNSAVSICVFSQLPDIGDFGFYSQATAREISDHNKLVNAIDVKYQQKGLPVPPISDFVGESNLRLYSAQVTSAWVNDDQHIKTKIDLDVIKNTLKSLQSPL